MKHTENWREFILSAVILALMFTIVHLSFVIDNKKSEIERLQRRVWEYQEKNKAPTRLGYHDDFRLLYKRFIEDDHR